MDASVHQVSTPNSATRDRLALEQKQTLDQGSIPPCKDNNVACCSMTTSLALKMRAAQSHTLTLLHSAHLFRIVFTLFWPPYAHYSTDFTPNLPPVLPQQCSVYPDFISFLPSYYLMFYPLFAHFVKGKIPHLPQFYPSLSLFTPPSVLPRF